MLKFKYGETALVKTSGEIGTIIGKTGNGLFCLMTPHRILHVLAENLDDPRDSDLQKEARRARCGTPEATEEGKPFAVTNHEYLVLRDKLAAELFLKRNKDIESAAQSVDEIAEKCATMADTLVRHIYKRKIVIPVNESGVFESR
jgi:hypothetical protein